MPDELWEELGTIALTGWLRFDGRLYGECACCGHGPTRLTPFGDSLYAMCFCCGTRWCIEPVTLVGVPDDADGYDDLMYAGIVELAQCVELAPRLAQRT